jgi:glycosyltransferase involved in cell wall biosynthesis
MKNKIEASVILPTYNRLPLLKNCLQAFSNQTAKSFEIILIDDCSDDGTKEYIEKHDFKNLRYVRLEKRSGPYYARNLGIKEAKGEVIIFVDSDVIVFPNFVEDHMKIHKKEENIVVQGMVKHIKNLKKVNMNSFYLPNALCLRTFITQNASVRRKYLISVGGFEEFGPKMGYKDVDMGLKLRDLGLSWKYGIIKCKAFHIDGEITEENLMNIFEKWTKQGASACYFVGKWGEKGEKYARTKKALFFSDLLCTHKWVEGGNMPRLVEYSRKNFVFLYWILIGFIRYHYRSKGIKEVMIIEGISDCSEL